MPLVRLNLGCPKYCELWTCVDLHPKDDCVIQYEAVEYLKKIPKRSVDVIRAYNLIEHLPNVGRFFEQSWLALKSGGLLEVRTDNAEFLPFYIPYIHRLGWGAHSSDEYYPEIMNNTKHYAVYTKLHLQHFAKEYRFYIVKIHRVTFGARLLVVYKKP